MGKPLGHMSGDAYVIDPENEARLRFTRISRLPLFLTGISLLGKVVYDTVNYFTNGEPIGYGTYAQQAISGVGFISRASSMYLKRSRSKTIAETAVLENRI